MAVVSSAVLSRKAFLAQAVPIHLKGIGGPGAPHEFLFQRRCNTGYLDQLGPVRDRRPFQQFIYIPKYIIFILYILWNRIPGLSREMISDTFFRLEPSEEGADDVILSRLHWLRDVGNLKRCNFSSFAVGLRFWSPQVPSKDNSWMTKIDFLPACPGPCAGCTIEIMATPCCSTLRSGPLLCYHLECPQARIKTMKIEESGLEPMFLCPSWCMLNTSALQSWARRNRLGRATATTFWSTFRCWGTLFTSWTRQLTILRIGSTGCCRRPHCWMYLRDSARLVWSLRNVYFSFHFLDQ